MERGPPSLCMYMYVCVTSRNRFDMHVCAYTDKHTYVTCMTLHICMQACMHALKHKEAAELAERSSGGSLETALAAEKRLKLEGKEAQRG